jgi:hypothetical protein
MPDSSTTNPSGLMVDVETIELRVLGAPVLATSTGLQPFAPERLYQLLACLALRGEWVSRDELTGLLWPDLPAASALRNLRKLLFRLNGLAVQPPVQTQPGSVRWVPRTDLLELGAALREGRLPQALASLPDRIRGCGHVKRAGANVATLERRKLLTEMRVMAGCEVSS